MAINTDRQRAEIFKRLSKANIDFGLSVADDNRKHNGQEKALRSLSQKSVNELCEYFCRVLGAHNTKIHTIDAIIDLPSAVADYLNQCLLPPVIYGGNNPMLSSLAWINAGIQWQEEVFSLDGLISIAEAECAIADTGTVVLLSSDKNPTRNNFLAEHHIVLLHKQSIKAYSEDAWAHLIATYPTLPRAINFISGPSSSADVGLKLEYGAHGPRSLAIFIVNN